MVIFTMIVALFAPAIMVAGNLVNTTYQLEDVSYYVPCANGGLGEEVRLEGNVHFVENMTIDKKNKVHYRVLIQTTNVVGIGLTTGTPYRASDTFNWTYYGDPDNYSTINTTKLVAPGGGNNLSLINRFKIQDGVVIFNEFIVECGPG